MKKLVLFLFVILSASSFAADTTLKGYLVDTACVMDEGKEPGFGAKHTKLCLRMSDCVKSGYGVLTEDQKYIKFDDAGNEQAKKIIAHLTKDNNIKVTVTGTVDGDKVAVTKITLD